MKERIVRTCAVAVVCAAVASVAAAQWSSDPAINLAVADRTGGETLPLVAAAPDGGTYVAWFDGTSGGFRVFLQRLDAAGVEQWPHNGVLISDHPQDSALFGWDLIADAAGGAVLVFSDVRDGGDLDVHAYRIAADGSFLWGADGVTLSDNADFEPAPRVAEASDGDFVFVWQRVPSSGDGDVRMQRLSPAGSPRYPSGPIAVAASPGESPGFVSIVPADAGSVILSWLRDTRTFASPRHLRAEKFSPAGSSLWGGPTSVYDAFSLPIGYFPGLLADGAGGAVLLWHRSDGTWFNAFVQRLDGSGVERWAHNGVAVSTAPGLHHLNPGFAFDAADGNVFVFWLDKNGLQSQAGLLGQRITPDGDRAWGASGILYIPVGPTELFTPRSVAYGDGAMAFLMDTPAAGVQRILGLRVDRAGSPLWSPALREVASAPSGKSRYPVAADAGGGVRIAWEDDRSGNVDIYAQNVRPDGGLGLPADPGRIPASLRLGRVPGDAEVELSWSASCVAGTVDEAIYEGPLGAFDRHERRTCSDADGDRRERLVPDFDDAYYLVVPLSDSAEGSYGAASDGAERPPPVSAADRCRPLQAPGACPP